MTYELTRVNRSKNLKTYTFVSPARERQRAPGYSGSPDHAKARSGVSRTAVYGAAERADARRAAQSGAAVRQGNVRVRTMRTAAYGGHTGTRRAVRNPGGAGLHPETRTRLITRMPENTRTALKVNNRAGVSVSGKTARQTGLAQTSAVDGKKTAVAEKVTKAPVIRTVKAVRTIPFPTAVVSMAVICTVLFMFMIISYVRINEYTVDIENLQGKLTDLMVQKKELTLQLEKKNDLRVIEKYATEVLGMVKIDQLAKKYITVPVQDKIEVVEDDKKAGGSMGGFLNTVEQYFKDLMEYIG